MIPESFFSEIGRKSPFMVDKGTLYQLYYEPRTVKGEIVVRFSGLTLYGLPSLKIEQLEKRFLGKHESEIIEMQEAVLKKVIKEAEVYSEQKLKDTLSKFETAAYIINEILPNFTESRDDIAGLLKNNKDKPTENLLDKIIGKEYTQKELSDSEFSKIKAKLLLEVEQWINPEAARKRRNMETNTTPTVDPVDVYSEQDELMKLLKKKSSDKPPARPLEQLIINKDVIRNENPDTIKDVLSKRVLCIFDNIYIGDVKGLEFFDTLENFDLLYRKMHEKNFIIESIDKYEDQIKKTGSIRAKTDALSRVLQKNAIEIGDIGFGTNGPGGQNYVYLKVPRFALHDPNSFSSYYIFDACKVGVTIQKSGSSVNYAGPFVVEAYRHPFLSSGASHGWGSICMGSYSNPGIDNTERIINLLSHGKNVIQRGYIRGSNPYHKLAESGYFRSISKSDIDRQKIPVTNVWR